MWLVVFGGLDSNNDYGDTAVVELLGMSLNLYSVTSLYMMYVIRSQIN